MLFSTFSDFLKIKICVIKDFSAITRAEYMNVVLYPKRTHPGIKIFRGIIVRE